jgi:CrcB protein
MIKSVIIVGIGGFIGTVARFLVSRYFQENVASMFPWATFLVNILGCLIIGVIFGLSEKGNMLNENLRLFLAVGFCGGFTTFSTFANESLLLMRNYEWIRFALYTTFSFFLGLVAVYLGRLLGRI